MDELVFTVGAVLDLLLQIHELEDQTIGISDGPNGLLQLNIGISHYLITEDLSESVEVSVPAIKEVGDVNERTIHELEDDGSLVIGDSVNSGFLKELVKTLSIGGLVRLTRRLLK